MTKHLAWWGVALSAGGLLALAWWGWQQGGLALMQLGIHC